MNKLPKTRKGFETMIRKIVQEELDDRADQDTGVVRQMTPDELKAQQRQAELDKIYSGVEVWNFY